jgi:cytochrome c oxidase subunit 2
MRKSLRHLLLGTAALVMAGAFGAAVHGQGTAAGNERVVEIAVKKFEYMPAEITLKKGEPVRLELTSLDRLHGFDLPDLGVRVDVRPDETATVHLTPTKTGQFVFHCDIFCGDGHEDLQGVITVVD